MMASHTAHQDMGIKDFEFVECYKQKQRADVKLKAFACTKCPEFEEHYSKMHDRKRLGDAVSKLTFKLSDESKSAAILLFFLSSFFFPSLLSFFSSSVFSPGCFFFFSVCAPLLAPCTAGLHMLPDYNHRIQVLKELGYIDVDDTSVQLKGRVACEISTCNELLATELVFSNSLTNLEPAVIVALLSSTVFQEKVDVDLEKLPSQLLEGMEMLKETCKMVGEEQVRWGMDAPVDEFVRENLHFGLVEVVYAWARGVAFSDIMMMTDVAEGSIVRCIVRLDESLRDIRNAARVVGDPVLHSKMEEASQMIKRDIVFSASLYTA
jgi:antiviral helicase SKI2